MFRSSRHVRVIHALLWLACASVPVHAQTPDDGIMLARREFLTGTSYSHDSWDQYWEGTLRRRNGNIGTITTQTNVFSANYGLANRLNVIAMVPYVRTSASQGVLHGIQGLQDLTVAAKLNAFERSFASAGSLRAIGVLSAGVPLTDYNPELLPLSIGLGSTRVSWRGTLHYQSTPGWFLTGSTAYAWRSQVRLDRPYFYTNDEFVMSDQVDMPNALELAWTGGYLRRGLMAAISLSHQKTLGGGDIRRQDMPFVSNRMDFARLGAMVMYPVPHLRTLGIQFGVAHTFSGRNVGQATAVTTGLQYVFNGEPIQ